jgi:hypothetical protein
MWHAWGEGRGVYRVLVGRLEGKNWIQLAQNRDQWRACVNTVMNLRIP